MIEIDNLHYNFRQIDGYNKAFNFIMSAREPGKTTMAWLTKVYFPWKINHKPWIYFVRNTVEICEALIESIADTTLNKFTDDNIEFQYNKGSFKDGIVDIKIEGQLFIRIVSLSIQLRRIKLAVLHNIGGVLMDEYIINPRSGEKYGKDEAFKIKEAYTTWRRESEGVLKCYFLANPYSLYNPLFMDWGVDTNKLKKNSFYVGDNFVIHWAILNPLLREKLLKDNPLYKFDEEYSNYALEGTAINDANIKIDKLPPNYALQFLFKIDSTIIGIYKNNYINDMQDKYFCCELDNIGKKRNCYCFDFEEVIERCAIVSYEDRMKFSRFKKALEKNEVAFSKISIYYLIIEIYKFI